MLGFFKYFNFFAENVHAVLSAFDLDVSMPALAIVLPVGISFYTFQELSYTIEVYRGELKARRDFLDFAMFVCSFRSSSPARSSARRTCCRRSSSRARSPGPLAQRGRAAHPAGATSRSS